jgi:hypothetical protein
MSVFSLVPLRSGMGWWSRRQTSVRIILRIPWFCNWAIWRTRINLLIIICFWIHLINGPLAGLYATTSLSMLTTLVQMIMELRTLDGLDLVVLGTVDFFCHLGKSFLGSHWFWRPYLARPLLSRYVCQIQNEHRDDLSSWALGVGFFRNNVSKRVIHFFCWRRPRSLPIPPLIWDRTSLVWVLVQQLIDSAFPSLASAHSCYFSICRLLGFLVW